MRSGMDKAAVHRALKSFESLGYLVRDSNDQDKRLKPWELTVKSQKVYEEVVPCALALEIQLLGEMSLEERKVLASRPRKTKYFLQRSASPTHRSTRTLAEHLGTGATTIRRVWHSHGLKPHLSRGFKLSSDPRFQGKLLDVVGLYMNPPEHALVLSCDEKSQIQALNRTQPGLPMKRGRAGPQHAGRQRDLDVPATAPPRRVAQVPAAH